MARDGGIRLFDCDWPPRLEVVGESDEMAHGVISRRRGLAAQ